MPADISIDRIAPAAASPITADASPAQTGASQTEAAKSPLPNLPNPLLTVDPSVNRVVLEFFSSSGVLTNSIPSQRQLDAYRLAAVSQQNSDMAGGKGD